MTIFEFRASNLGANVFSTKILMMVDDAPGEISRVPEQIEILDVSKTLFDQRHRAINPSPPPC